MTTALERAASRIRETVTQLDRTVRAYAIDAVAEEAVSLTDGQIENDGALVMALARVAVRNVRSSGPVLGGRAPSRGDPVERAQREAADRVDCGMVALTSAAQLVGGCNARDERDSLDFDKLLEVVMEIAQPESHRLLREGALTLMARALGRLPPSERALTLGIVPLRVVRQFACGQGASRFVQRAALEVLVQVKGAEVEEDLLGILASAGGPDGMIIRHHVVALIPRSALSAASQLRSVWAQRKDPSEHVRQGVVRALAVLGQRQARAYQLLTRLSLVDASPRINALGLLELARAAAQGDSAQATRSFIQVLSHACRSENPVLHRAALAATRLIAASAQRPILMSDLAAGLAALIRDARLDTAEMAATLARELQMESDPARQALCAELRQRTRERSDGQSFRVDLSPALDEKDLEQAAYVVACLDLVLEIVPRKGRTYELRRGERRGLRLWRLIHEFGHRGPDKRQSYLHSHARLAIAHTTTVPIRQAEVTPTLVPGERRILIGSSWGCFLPRVDDIFAACRAPRGKRLISAFGTLTVRAPEGFFARAKLWARLTRRYAELSQLRDQSLTAATQDGKRRFALELRRLGVEIELSDSALSLGGRPVSTLPASVPQFFSVLPLPLALWLEDALQYVVSPSGNTAWHLSMVVWVLLSLMVVRASRVQRRFAHARQKIPLSIGGWGSRGKSGTERLKSALFHSRHADVVSKTTGCEAMLILARRDQTAHEIFLYRPYDKATIWEQEAVVEYAESLGAQVFLWECMALQPEFVEILNREWMKDRITTITNAYPDHEDIMGPSGEDVARVIGRFIPIGGTVLSSEEQMEAFIRESATRRGSQLIEVDELAADLLPRDLLDRFPYQEHPRNVALALRLAEHLGFDRERSLIDIADYVVPDLGVLNVFPKIPFKARSLRFSNGMSANERAGFMSNWNRLYFVSHDPDKHSDTILAAVINNRADRVARSRVFADVFARDVAVDRMIVIGTNTSGMKQFMYESIAVEAAQIRPPESAADAPQWIETTFNRLGVPKTLDAVERRLRLMSRALLGPSPDAAAEQEIERLLTAALATLSDPDAPGFDAADGLKASVARTLEPLSECLGRVCLAELAWAETPALRQAEHHATLMTLVAPWVERRYWTNRLAQLIAPATSPPLLQGLRATYRRLFEERVIILEHSDFTGDQVVDFVFRQIPPGLHAEVMGCQNIKGTGLDFVYRFVELQRVHDWLVKLDMEPSERPAILSQMKSHIDYGLFGCQYAMARVQSLLAAAAQDWAPQLASLRELQSYLQTRERFFINKMSRTTTKSRWHVVLGWLEPWVDNLDGIRRRKRADRIMHALISGEMNTATAAEALRTVVARQKGGWLAKDFTNAWARLSRRALVTPERPPEKLVGDGATAMSSRTP
jgi:gamma-polyglutamate synthase